jgi:hypothetical protein
MVKNISTTGKIYQVVEVEYAYHREMLVHCIVREHQDSVTYELQARIKWLLDICMGTLNWNL